MILYYLYNEKQRKNIMKKYKAKKSTLTENMSGLTQAELMVIKKLKTPILIQDYLDTLPVNWEKKGETYMSPRRVLRMHKAHCLEGALLACVALWLYGHEPLLLDLKSFDGDDHVVALYQCNGYFGGISKTNHATLRFRDPVYKTVRELALSYFHEYINIRTGEKKLRSYSRPFNLKKWGTSWITDETELFHIAVALDKSPHEDIAIKRNIRLLRKADKMERKAGRIIEWSKKHPKT